MKKPSRALIIVFIAILLLPFIKDAVVKAGVESAMEFVTGLPLGMKGFKVGIFKTVIDIKGLKVSNPRGFADRAMLDMPEAYVSYDLPSIMKGHIILKEVRLHLKELVVVKNEKGVLNIDSLKFVKERKAKKAEKKEKEKGKASTLHIESLYLKVGRVIYKDYSAGGAPDIKEFNLNLNEKYRNINDPEALVSLIVFRSLANTSISRLANFDLGLLKNPAGSASEIAAGILGTAGAGAKQAGEKLKSIFKSLQQED